MRSLDWSKTRCGPPASWPPTLKNIVIMCLGAGTPMMVGWGPPDYLQFYNDAAIPTLGDKHPLAMGQPARAVWPEGDVADIVIAIADQVVRTGLPVALNDSKLVLNRRGRLESAYFTFSFSPILDEHCQLRGVFNTFVETTGRVLGERRLRALRELAVGMAEAPSAHAACAQAADAMAFNRSDIPLALVYWCDQQGASASLSGVLGLAPGEPSAPHSIRLDDDGSEWPLGQVAGSGEPELVGDLVHKFGPLSEAGRPPPCEALVLPAGEAPVRAFLVAGINPHRLLDEQYRGYLQLVAASIGAGVANAHAHQAARERAERLAEIDRAKTTFISNISHEFRTPIALILGPVDDLLSGT